MFAVLFLGLFWVVRCEISLFPSTCGLDAGVRNAFDRIYSDKTWCPLETCPNVTSIAHYYTYGDVSRFRDRRSSSGPGSRIGSRTVIETLDFISETITKYSVNSMLDICGDANWQMESMEIDLIDTYVGIDISKQVINMNSERFRFHANKYFSVWDVSSCPIPKYSNTFHSLHGAPQHFELIVVKEVMIHLNHEHASRVAHDLKKSGALVLATTFHEGEDDKEGPTESFLPNGRFWRINMANYDFPEPIKCIPEMSTQQLCLYDFR